MDPPSTGDLRRWGTPLTGGWPNFFGSPHGLSPLVFSGDAEIVVFRRVFTLYRGRRFALTRLLLKPIKLPVFSKTYGRVLDAFFAAFQEVSKG